MSDISHILVYVRYLKKRMIRVIGLQRKKVCEDLIMTYSIYDPVSNL